MKDSRKTELTNGYTVETWYDRSARVWITNLKDTAGCQVGNAEMDGNKTSAQLSHKFMIDEGNQVIIEPEAAQEQASTIEDNPNYNPHNGTVCVADFCGRDSLGPVTYWAGWHVTKKTVVFGGDWHNVPDMPADTEPDEQAVYTWAENYEAEQAGLRAAGSRHLEAIKGRLNADGAADDTDAELERCLGLCVCGPWLVRVARAYRAAGHQLIDRVVKEHRSNAEIADLIQTALDYANKSMVVGMCAEWQLEYNFNDTTPDKQRMANYRPLYLAFMALCRGDSERASLLLQDHTVIEWLNPNPVTAGVILNDADMSPEATINYLRIT